MSAVNNQTSGLTTRDREPVKHSFYECWDRSYQICSKVITAIGDCFKIIGQTVIQYVDENDE